MITLACKKCQYLWQKHVAFLVSCGLNTKDELKKARDDLKKIHKENVGGDHNVGESDANSSS